VAAITVAQALNRAIPRLRDAGVRKPERDARILLCHVLATDKSAIIAHPERELNAGERDLFFALVIRRCRFEPVQYLTGVQPFWDTYVKVGKGCLIPRPETEILVEETTRIAAGFKSPVIADLGCGSGAILKALSGSISGARFMGLDLENEALCWAKQNLEGLRECVLLKADFGGKKAVLKSIDILVSNPPYITPGEFKKLPAEIRKYEPETALLASDPLEPYRKIALFAEAALKPGGFLLFEIGSAQALRHRAFSGLSKDLEVVSRIKDYGGKLRVMVLKRIKPSGRFESKLYGRSI